MELTDSAGNHLCHYVHPMTTLCVQCKKPVLPDDGVFMAVGHPYYAVLHKWCAPHFTYNGEWPHPYPSSVYNKKAPT